LRYFQGRLVNYKIKFLFYRIVVFVVVVCWYRNLCCVKWSQLQNTCNEGVMKHVK